MAGRRLRVKAANPVSRARTPRGAAAPRRVSGDERLEALAKRWCPRQTAAEVHADLVPASRGRRLTAEAARALAVDRVAAVVARVCEWGRLGQDWDVGDYRYLVLSFALKGDVGFYVQLWTEPEEPVLVEACSGAWNPPARPYVGPPQRAALRRLGYRVGGRARNFGKRWTLSPLANARALAAELVTILVDVFGYRAARPLELKYFAGSRTLRVPVFPALGRDDVERMLKMGGCRVISATPAGRVPPGVRKRLIHVAEPFPLAVELKGEVAKEPHGYEAMRFITPIEAGQGVSDAQLAAIARDCPFLRVFRDDDGGVLAIYDVPVAGTTVRWFLLTLRVVAVMRARAVAMVQEALAASCGPAAGAREAGDGAGGGGAGPAVLEAGPDGDGPADGDDLAEDDDPADEEDADASVRRGRSGRVVVH